MAWIPLPLPQREATTGPDQFGDEGWTPVQSASQAAVAPTTADLPPAGPAAAEVAAPPAADRPLTASAPAPAWPAGPAGVPVAQAVATPLERHASPPPPPSPRLGAGAAAPGSGEAGRVAAPEHREAVRAVASPPLRAHRRDQSGPGGTRPLPAMVTLVLLVLVLVAPVAAFGGVNAADRRGWATQIATDCLRPREPTPGACVGVLRVPKLGADWARPIIDGDQTGTGGTGAIWLTGTTPPGQVGNFVLAGRRLGGGQPFAGLDRLDAGDEIVVETPGQTYTYVVEVAPRSLTTTKNDSWVLDPVPGNAEIAPQKALLTLVLRQDTWPTRDRSIGVAVLRDTQNR